MKVENGKAKEHPELTHRAKQAKKTPADPFGVSKPEGHPEHKQKPPQSTSSLLLWAVLRLCSLIIYLLFTFLVAVVVFIIYDQMPIVSVPSLIFSALNSNPRCLSAGTYLHFNGAEATEGLHVVCFRQKGNEWVADVWKNSQVWDHWTIRVGPMEKEEDVRTVFDEKIIDRKPKTPEAIENQEPWKFFTPNGTIISTPAHMQEVAVVLLYEGGQFMWPGVHVGFKRTVEVDIGTVTLTTISMEPLVLNLDRFLLPEEADAIVNRAMKDLKPSTVLDNGKVRMGSEEGVWSARTCTHTWLVDEDDLVKKIDLRVEGVSRLPKHNQEHTQVVRYQEGQRLHAHHDYHVIDAWDPELIKKDRWDERLYYGYGNRMATVLWYMTDVKKGGETWFSSSLLQLFVHHAFRATPPGMCTYGPMAKAVKGQAVLFYSLRPSGVVNEYSLHTGCRVLEGEKLIANKWIWNRKFRHI
eukprot:comp17413_c0_seq1/m.16772 comp17413_c0_seq1/g.16772  ORF comp17413_c0_seq1/g.16772 comp17413_c0_seq1/m.16772 type:complete len:467 (-) comp17413_c0_seq1:626-2026(-)